MHSVLVRKTAGDLSISERTVKWHLANIYRKLGVHIRTEAVVVALD
jgi:DNA-binding CsgD family transcriptional regulator